MCLDTSICVLQSRYHLFCLFPNSTPTTHTRVLLYEVRKAHIHNMGLEKHKYIIWSWNFNSLNKDINNCCLNVLIAIVNTCSVLKLFVLVLSLMSLHTLFKPKTKVSNLKATNYSCLKTF